MTEKQKRLKDLVVPLSDYPHLPCWGKLREAVAQINIAYGTGHQALLVYGEDHRLVGMLSQKDILRGLVPRLAEPDPEGIPAPWDLLLRAADEKRLDLPIEEFMSPVKTVGNAADSILEAARSLLHENTYLLPVMEAGKLIGVARMGDIFHEITNTVLKL